MEKDDIKKLAYLARLGLSDEEVESLSKEIGSILKYVDEIKEVSADSSEEEEFIVRNVFREDEDPHPKGEWAEDLLEASPEREGQYIKVKKIL